MSADILANARVLSGIRPTSPTLHIGNYFGALRPFIAFQDQFPNRCFYFIADLHTIGDVVSPQQMKDNCLGTAVEFLASGIDPTKATLYIQSAVPQLAHLCWLLTAATLDTELLALPHYREKRDKYAEKQKVEGAPATYLMYPILQAADILFTANAGERILVPVGSDQRPHIEFTRDVSRRFNSRYTPLFGEPTLPEDIGIFADPEQRGDIRIKGLDGQAKMGKSDGNCIFLEDEPDEIARLVKRGTTDPQRQRLGDPGDPEKCIGIYPLHQFVTNKDVRESTIIPGCTSGSLSCKDCKAILSSNLTEMFAQFRIRKAELQNNLDYVEEVLRQGANRVRKLVDDKLTTIHEAMGLHPYEPRE